jgi:hypothetical protein
MMRTYANYGKMSLNHPHVEIQDEAKIRHLQAILNRPSPSPQSDDMTYRLSLANGNLAAAQSLRRVFAENVADETKA